MARVELSEGWAAGGDVRSVQAAVHGFLRSRGMEVVGEQLGEVHARRAAWLARVVGERFVPVGWLPLRVLVKFRRTTGGVAVRVSLEEASAAVRLAPPVLDRYYAYFTAWVRALRAWLRARGPVPQPAAA